MKWKKSAASFQLLLVASYVVWVASASASASIGAAKQSLPLGAAPGAVTAPPTENDDVEGKKQKKKQLFIKVSSLVLFLNAPRFFF